jgi:hypothetical protein
MSRQPRAALPSQPRVADGRPPYMPAINFRLLLACGASILVPPLAVAQQTPRPLADFLTRSIGLEAAQLPIVERGEPVVRVLETKNPRDVAIFGIVAVSTSRSTYVRKLLDPASALGNAARVHFGVFGNPAAVADIRAFTVSRDDLKDLRKCQARDCDFKLPATEIRRLQEQLTGSLADQQARVSDYARQRLVTYVNDYRARGDAALVVYDDNGGIRASDAFGALLAESPYVFKYVPALARFLSGYPGGALAGASDVIYWAEDEPPHLRRTLSVTHRVVYAPPELSDMTLVASKQIYANHYFEAAFDLMSVVDRAGGSGSGGSYLMMLRRYRFDNLPNGGLLNIRGRVIRALREAMLADLGRDAGHAAP